MKRPKALAMISITLTAFVISGCGITIAQSSSNSSDSESSAPASNSPEQNVSDLPSTPQIISMPASSALSEALSNTSESFWLLANHEQYLTGVVTDCHFETYPQKSYICFTSNGQEYRIEGSLGREGEGLLQFHNQGSYSGKDSEECHSGWYIVTYFEDDLATGQTIITQPKDIFLSLPMVFIIKFQKWIIHYPCCIKILMISMTKEFLSHLKQCNESPTMLD